MAEKRPLQVAYGALCAVSAAAVVQLAAGNCLDIPLRISIGCLGVAIPFLAVLFYSPIPHIDPPTSLRRTQRTYYTVSVVAPWLCILGLTALFWHFGWAFGVLFAISSSGAHEILKRWSAATDFFDDPH
jgi:hypothetical protein